MAEIGLDDAPAYYGKFTMMTPLRLEGGRTIEPSPTMGFGMQKGNLADLDEGNDYY